MRTPQSYPVVLKIVKVIESCKTLEQLRVAFRMVNRLTVYEQWHICYLKLTSKITTTPCAGELHYDLLQEHYYRRMK